MKRPKVTHPTPKEAIDKLKRWRKRKRERRSIKKTKRCDTEPYANRLVRTWTFSAEILWFVFMLIDGLLLTIQHVKYFKRNVGLKLKRKKKVPGCRINPSKTDDPKRRKKLTKTKAEPIVDSNKEKKYKHKKKFQPSNDPVKGRKVAKKMSTNPKHPCCNMKKIKKILRKIEDMKKPLKPLIDCMLLPYHTPTKRDLRGNFSDETVKELAQLCSLMKHDLQELFTNPMTKIVFLLIAKTQQLFSNCIEWLNHFRGDLTKQILRSLTDCKLHDQTVKSHEQPKTSTNGLLGGASNQQQKQQHQGSRTTTFLAQQNRGQQVQHQSQFSPTMNVNFQSQNRQTQLQQQQQGQQQTWTGLSVQGQSQTQPNTWNWGKKKEEDDVTSEEFSRLKAIQKLVEHSTHVNELLNLQIKLMKVPFPRQSQMLFAKNRKELGNLIRTKTRAKTCEILSPVHDHILSMSHEILAESKPLTDNSSEVWAYRNIKIVSHFMDTCEKLLLPEERNLLINLLALYHGGWKEQDRKMLQQRLKENNSDHHPSTQLPSPQVRQEQPVKRSRKSILSSIFKVLPWSHSKSVQISPMKPGLRAGDDEFFDIDSMTKEDVLKGLKIIGVSPSTKRDEKQLKLIYKSELFAFLLQKIENEDLSTIMTELSIPHVKKKSQWQKNIKGFFSKNISHQNMIIEHLLKVTKTPIPASEERLHAPDPPKLNLDMQETNIPSAHKDSTHPDHTGSPSNISEDLLQNNLTIDPCQKDELKEKTKHSEEKTQLNTEQGPSSHIDEQGPNAQIGNPEPSPEWMDVQQAGAVNDVRLQPPFFDHSDHRQVSLPMVNTGSDCFAISVLNMLGALPTFIQAYTWPVNRPHFQLDGNLNRQIMAMLGDPSQQRLQKLAQIIRCEVANARFPTNTERQQQWTTQQQDAHEMFAFMLELLQQQLVPNSTMLQELFCHQFTVLETCTSCNHHQWIEADPESNTLTLSITKNTRSLQEALRQHCHSQVDRDRTCINNHRTVVHNRQLTTCPQNLVVQLKRMTSAGQKLNHDIQAPLRWEPTKGVVYELSGYCEHVGQTSRYGHYITYQRDTQNGHVIMINDNITAKTPEHSPNQAYILVYTKTSDTRNGQQGNPHRAMGGPRSSSPDVLPNVPTIENCSDEDLDDFFQNKKERNKRFQKQRACPLKDPHPAKHPNMLKSQDTARLSTFSNEKFPASPVESSNAEQEFNRKRKPAGNPIPDQPPKRRAQSQYPLENELECKECQMERVHFCKEDFNESERAKESNCDRLVEFDLQETSLPESSTTTPTVLELQHTLERTYLSGIIEDFDQLSTTQIHSVFKRLMLPLPKHQSPTYLKQLIASKLFMILSANLDNDVVKVLLGSFNIKPDKKQIKTRQYIQLKTFFRNSNSATQITVLNKIQTIVCPNSLKSGADEKKVEHESKTSEENMLTQFIQDLADNVLPAFIPSNFKHMREILESSSDSLGVPAGRQELALLLRLFSIMLDLLSTDDLVDIFMPLWHVNVTENRNVDIQQMKRLFIKAPEPAEWILKLQAHLGTPPILDFEQDIDSKRSDRNSSKFSTNILAPRGTPPQSVTVPIARKLVRTGKTTAEPTVIPNPREHATMLIKIRKRQRRMFLDLFVRELDRLEDTNVQEGNSCIAPAEPVIEKSQYDKQTYTDADQLMFDEDPTDWETVLKELDEDPNDWESVLKELDEEFEKDNEDIACDLLRMDIDLDNGDIVDNNPDIQPNNEVLMDDPTEELANLFSQLSSQGLDDQNEEQLVDPLIEAGKKVHETLNSMMMEQCKICHERWFDLGVGPITGRCERCSRDMKNLKKQKGVPLTFSYENNMDPCEQPECLRRLNSVEIAAISRICPAQNIYKLRHGGVKQRGHSVSFLQDVGEFAQRLPRGQPELPWCILKAPNQSIPLTANRVYMLEALEWLVQNNPYYADVIIDHKVLNTYPDNRSENLTGVLHLNLDEPLSDEAFDMAVQQTQDEQEPDVNVDEVVPSMMTAEVASETVRNFIKEAVLGQKTSDDVILWPKRADQPASEFVEGFYTMSHPNLFPYGMGDISIPRPGKKPEFMAWLRHLLYYKDGRFAKDFRFILNAVNIFRRHKALTISNVYAKKVCSNMSMAQVKDKVANNDDSLLNSLLYFGATIPGTRQYFKYEASKSTSFERFVRIESNNQGMLNVFLTFSLPDFHMPELHRLLPGSEQYLDKIVVKKTSDIPAGEDNEKYITSARSYELRQKAIRENAHIINFFGTKRLQLVIKHVLEEVLGVSHWILRHEYQSRSSLHWHLAVRMEGLLLADAEKAFKNYRFDLDWDETDLTEMERENPEMQKLLRTHPVVSAGEQQRVEEARRRTVDFATNHLGISEVHPQPDPKEWPGPEGQALSAPQINCLTDNFLNFADNPDYLAADYERLCNRVQLHRCTKTYCLKENKAGGDYCRFRFPMQPYGFVHVKKDVGTNKSYLDEIHLQPDVHKGAAFQGENLCFLRNHPRLVKHVPQIASLWRGNTDATLFKSVGAVVRYILKYMSKPESSSVSFLEIAKHLAEKVDEDCPTRKLFAQILLKTVAEHDVSLNECMKMISGGAYVEYSHGFKSVSLTDNRLLNTKAQNDNASATGKNVSDHYWNRHDDPNFQKLCDSYGAGDLPDIRPPHQISLYHYASHFNNQWVSLDRPMFPHPTPNFKYVPKPDNEKYRKTYCETTLLLHNPESHPDNIIGDFDTAEAALHNFVYNNPLCPISVGHDYKESCKHQVDTVPQDDDIQQLIASQMSGVEEDFEQDDVMQALSTKVIVNILERDEPVDYLEDDAYEDINTDNFGVDWSVDRCQLSLTSDEVDAGATDWIDTMRAQTNLPDQMEGVSIDPDTLNKEQRYLYDMVKELIDAHGQGSSTQRLIDLSGGAGCGKTYTIKAMLQYAKETNEKNKKNFTILVAAPTGSAASLLPNGCTLHSLLKIQVENNLKEHQDELTGVRLAVLQDAFKDTCILIIDEKSMVGLGRLSQISRRLQQAKPHAKTEPFGGVTVILVGDLNQLPPVMDKSVCSLDGGSLVQREGRNLYRQFTTAVNFKESVRQGGDANKEFRGQLERLTTGMFTEDDYDAWCDRDLSRLSDTEQEHFRRNAVQLCSTRNATKSFNIDHIKRLHQPVLRIKATNTKHAANADQDKAKGLPKEVLIAKNAKVILTTNLWTDAKLVNGSQGTVRYVIFREGENPPDKMPAFLLVHFPDYNGPSFLSNEPGIVPITAIERSWFSGNEKCSRTQFPLMLGWSITIHKSQGDLGNSIVT